MSALNQAAFQWIHGFAGRNIVVDDLGTFFAAYLPYLLGFGFLALVALQPGARRKLYVFIEGALAVIISRGVATVIIYHFYFHPRPFLFYGFAPLISAAGPSFPSGHAAFFFALALAAWYADRTWGNWYLVLASLNGIARIYAGVHWPLDIIAGAALGLASAWAVHRILRRSRRNSFMPLSPQADILDPSS